jgi:type IV secretory pathway TraG/TraD family ATPase VirD4
MRNVGLILIVAFLFIIVDVALTVFFAVVPMIVKQGNPQNIVRMVIDLIQHPNLLLESAWAQMPFKVGQLVLLLLAVLLFFRAKGNRSKGYKEAYKHGAHGTSRWATPKEAFQTKYFVRKRPNKYLLQDVKKSFELQKEIENEKQKIDNGTAVIDQKIVDHVKESLLRLKRLEMNHEDKIKQEAESLPEEERQRCIDRELHLLQNRYLMISKQGEKQRYLLRDVEEEQLEELIPYSTDYVRELQKQKFQELYPRSGTILGIVKGSPVIQPFESKLGNRNVLVVGGSGAAKTQSIVFPNVLHQTQASLCITDPKGEVFSGTARIKEKQGYEVKVVNFANMRDSHCWNPLDYVRSEVDATTVASTIVASKNNPEKKDLWYNAQLALLRALILYAVHEFEPRKRNLNGILDFLREFEDTYDEEEEETALDGVFAELDFKHPARVAYELGYKKSMGRTRSGIMISMLTTVADFTSASVQRLTNKSDFMLGDLARKKTALYLIIDSDDDTFEGLVNLFIRQLFKELKSVGNENRSKTYVPVQFVLDEFANLGKLPNFSRFLSTCRGYGISVMPIIQNVSQLDKNYGDKEAESIFGNCSAKVLLKASDSKTQERFSKMLGQTTIKVNTSSRNKSRTGSSSGESESYMKRALLDPVEVENLPDDVCLITTDNTYPIYAQKPFQSNYFKDKRGQLIHQFTVDIQDYEFRKDDEITMAEDQKQWDSREKQTFEQRKEKLLSKQERKQQEEQLKERERKEQKQRELAEKARLTFEQSFDEDDLDLGDEEQLEDDLPEASDEAAAAIFQDKVTDGLSFNSDKAEQKLPLSDETENN